MSLLVRGKYAQCAGMVVCRRKYPVVARETQNFASLQAVAVIIVRTFVRIISVHHLIIYIVSPCYIYYLTLLYI